MFKTKPLPLSLSAVLLISLSSCDDDNNGGGNNQNVFDAIAGLPATVLAPSSNPSSNQKEELGRLLFFDPILSGNKDVACATCHHPSLAYADGIRRSIGVDGSGLGLTRRNGIAVDRNSPTVINTAFNGIQQNGNYDPAAAPMFWDNRANGLEEQALLPMLSMEEMRGQGIPEAAIVDTILQRLNAIPAYRNLFEQAFGSAQITETHLLAAIASYERSIIANNSPFDRYMRGEETALSNLQIEGMQTFVRVGCAECHSGPMLSDFDLHVLGVPDPNGIVDDGAENFRFRTPTLRNISLTAPYMHNGELRSLREVLEFYDDISGNNVDDVINDNVNPNNIAEEARDLDLDGDDIEEILAFLRSLEDQSFDKTIPTSVPSGLNVGGDIN